MLCDACPKESVHRNYRLAALVSSSRQEASALANRLAQLSWDCRFYGTAQGGQAGGRSPAEVRTLESRWRLGGTDHAGTRCGKKEVGGGP